MAKRLILTKSPGSQFTAATERKIIKKCLELRSTAKASKCTDYKKLPTFKRLRELLRHNKTEPDVYHHKSRGGMVAGQKAGSISNGYIQIYIDNIPYLAHRIIWKMQFGCDPEGQIDHKNGDRADNRIENLRDVSPVENSQNRHKANSNTGVLGVSYCKSTRRYLAYIGYGEKDIKLGRYIKLACAIKARKCAEKWLYNKPQPSEMEAA